MRQVNRSIAWVILLGGAIFLAGCAHDAVPTNPVVPSSAVQMATGDKAIAFVAPQDGVVYLRDDADNRLLYSTDVKKGQVVGYDPDTQQLAIDKSMTGDLIPGRNHQHSIFFHGVGNPESAARAEAAADLNSGRPTTRPSDMPVIHVPVGVQVEVQTQPSPPK